MRKSRLFPWGVLILTGGLAVVTTTLAVRQPGFVDIPIALLFLFIFSFSLLAMEGFEFDPINRRFRVFYQYINWKWGRWTDLNDYPFICIIERKVSSNRFSLPQGSGLSPRGIISFVEAFLLTKDHRKRIGVKKWYKESAEVEVEVQDIAEKLEIDFVKYNPQVSQATKNRRYRR